MGTLKRHHTAHDKRIKMKGNLSKWINNWTRRTYMDRRHSRKLDVVVMNMKLNRGNKH